MESIIPQNLDQCKTLRDFGYLVLSTSDPNLKAEYTFHAEQLWKEGLITEIGKVIEVDNPARPDNVKSCLPKDMPRRGKNKEGRGAMVHALVHVENIAIELSWDIMMRFDEKEYNLPKEFFDDWLRIASEESKHYSMLRDRLKEFYGKNYGDLPAHGNLWVDAMTTKNCLLERLVLEHCIHEARGLDVTEQKTIPGFQSSDVDTAELLKSVILPDEITHVREGLKWFKHVCTQKFQCQEEQQFIEKFHEYVKIVFKHDKFPGPFNEKARDQAGLTKEYYQPFIQEPKESNNKQE